MTNLVITIGFLFVCLSVATEANPNNISNKGGRIHSHKRRRLEDYDPGICADVYATAVECTEKIRSQGSQSQGSQSHGGDQSTQYDVTACYDCLGTGQTDPANPTCGEFDCQLFGKCMVMKCDECRDEIRASLECDVKRDCSITCNCDAEMDSINACISSYAWTGDFDMCSTCSKVGQSDPENMNCLETDCHAMSDCVETYCGGCEEEADEYFACLIDRDCKDDCDDVCYDVMKVANDCINSDVWTGNEMCVECHNHEYLCDDMKCEEINQCVQANCGGCTVEELAFFACNEEKICGTSCPSRRILRGLDAPKVNPKKLYKGAGSVNHIGAIKKPHKFGHRLR